MDGATATPLVDQDGAICTPFATIQQALDAVAANADPNLFDWTVWISPGLYDEDLVVNQGTAATEIALRGFGDEVVLGAGSPARTITWNNTLGGILRVEDFTVDGSIILVDLVGINGTFAWNGIDITGDIDGTAHVGDVVVALTSSVPGFGSIGGQVNCPSGLLRIFDMAAIGGDVTVATYGRVIGTLFTGNISVSAAVFGDDAGWFRCSFNGGALQTYTSPGVWNLDGTTNFYSKIPPVTLAGGAVKVILDDLVP